MPTHNQVTQLIDMAEQGDFLSAIRTFYADQATMQENDEPPRAGLENLVEHERKMLAAVKFRVNRAASFLIDGDRVAINWVYEIVDPAGETRHRNEIAYQLWRDGKIVQERFYYNSAQIAKA